MMLSDGKSLLFMVLLISSFSVSTVVGDECESGGGFDLLGCGQPGTDEWESPLDVDELDDDRNVGIDGHNKYVNYYMNSCSWCEAIRPCPVHGGTPSASHNAENAADAFKRGASWTSGVISKDALATDGVWVQYTYPGKNLALGFLMFEANEVTKVVLEGSNGSWETLRTERQAGDVTTLWQFKVIHDKTTGTKGFQSYRLRVTDTKWREAGEESGSVSISNIQFCLRDMIKTASDNAYTSIPTFIADAGAKPFASSRWGRNWNEGYAFSYPSRAWSSKYIYSNGDELSEPQHIGYSYPVPRIVRKISIMGSYQWKYLSHYPSTFSIQGSDDKQNWTTLKAVDDLPRFLTENHVEEMDIENIKPFRHYRIYVTKTGWSVRGASGGYVIMRAVKFC